MPADCVRVRGTYIWVMDMRCACHESHQRIDGNYGELASQPTLVRVDPRSVKPFARGLFVSDPVHNAMSAQSALFLALSALLLQQGLPDPLERQDHPCVKLCLQPFDPPSPDIWQQPCWDGAPPA